jgi:hypothetical protein
MPEETKVRTGLEILIDWANDEDGWVRSIASEVVATRRALTEASIEAAYQVFLAEKGLGEGPAPTVPLLSMSVAGVEAADDLRLTRLSALTGVNALSAGQVVDFNPKLTVLFGENAAGKTGYVRVLKRVASVRGAAPIIGNIRQPGSALGAKLEFSTGGSTQDSGLERRSWRAATHADERVRLQRRQRSRGRRSDICIHAR